MERDMDHEEVEAEAKKQRLRNDFRRGKPVELLAPVQHQLQRADAKR